MTTKPILAIGLMAAKAAMSVPAAIAQNQAVGKDSQNFIKAAIRCNLAEIDNGKLAQQKAKGLEVKAFGDMLVRDHAASNENAAQVTKQLGVTPPTGSGIAPKAEYLKLKVLWRGI
jgi:putative membrane protein